GPDLELRLALSNTISDPERPAPENRPALNRVKLATVLPAIARLSIRKSQAAKEKLRRRTSREHDRECCLEEQGCDHSQTDRHNVSSKEGACFRHLVSSIQSIHDCRHSS